MENTSPEERLFKVIQQGKNPSPGGDIIASKKSGTGWIAARIAELKRAVVVWKERLFSGNIGAAGKGKFVFPWKLDDIQLWVVNLVLAVLLLIFIAFGIYYAVSKYPNIAKVVSASARAQNSLAAANKATEQMHPLGYYTEDAKARDIFNASESHPAAILSPASAGSAKGPLGDLKLQGISWSDEPKVIIGNPKDNKMYVLKQGQVVGPTGVKVKTILRNKVILTYGGADFEL